MNPSGTHKMLPNSSEGSLSDHSAHHDMPVVACLPPKAIYEHIVDAGVAKSKYLLSRQITLGLLAGFYISFSFTTCMVVGGQIKTIQNEHPGLYNLIFGSFGFPLGLTIIVVLGADLFTSDCAYMMTALHEGRCSLVQLLKVWGISWMSNLCGCLFMAQLVYWAWVFHGREEFTIHLAEKKTSYPFGVALCKGIIANWLVNLAVWMANASQDMTGKAVAIFLPISAFMSMGLEHCIANQFLLPLAVMLGAPISPATIIIKNLIPVTIGNTIGGAFFVGTMYSFAHGSAFDTLDTYRQQAFKHVPGCSGASSWRQTPATNRTMLMPVSSISSLAHSKGKHKTLDDSGHVEVVVAQSKGH